jgi:hypothetical protein
VDLLDEVAEHRFGNLEIRDDAVFHGPNGHDISRRPSQHPFGFFADGQDGSGACLDRNDRWFTQNNSSISYINERIGGTQVYPNVIGKEGFKLR